MKEIRATVDTGDKLANYLTCFGHICTDINSGGIAATLPFLVFLNGYSYTAVTLLIFASNVASALIQPLFGWLGDKRPFPPLMAIGVFLAGAGMAGIGWAQEYWMVVVCAMTSGIGVAMFHPEGGRLANLSAGERKGNGMSIFAVGGNIGAFVGPLLAAGSMSLFGMHGTLVFFIPCAIATTVLLACNKRFTRLGGKAAVAAARKQSNAPDRWKKFFVLLAVLSMRSIVLGGLLSFIPLFLVSELGVSETTGSMALSLFAFFGAVGTIMSGRTAEKVGSYRLMIVGMAISVALIGAFALTRSLPIALLLTGCIALAVDIFYASTAALGMSYLPQHLGTASGLIYGVAFSVGGIAEPFLGMMGDAVGLQPVMMLLAGISALGVVIAVILTRVDS